MPHNSDISAKAPGVQRGKIRKIQYSFSIKKYFTNCHAFLTLCDPQVHMFVSKQVFFGLFP